jgi:signal transduction histidine kinase
MPSSGFPAVIISSKVRLDVQQVDLADVVPLTAETAGPTAEAKGVGMNVVTDPLHGPTISGDASRLQQVMWNLLTNAVKFTPRSGREQVLLERMNSDVGSAWSTGRADPTVASVECGREALRVRDEFTPDSILGVAPCDLIL